MSVGSFRPSGELGRLLVAVANTSDVRLRTALEAREEARARNEDALRAVEQASSAEEMSDLQTQVQEAERALEAASQAVSHAVAIKRQAVDVEHGIVPGTTPDSFAEAYADLLKDLDVDLECCPRARAVLLRLAPSPPADRAAEVTLSDSKLRVLAVVIPEPSKLRCELQENATCLHLFRTGLYWLSFAAPHLCLPRRVTVHCPFTCVHGHLRSALLCVRRRTACEARTHGLDGRASAFLTRIPERGSPATNV